MLVLVVLGDCLRAFRLVFYASRAGFVYVCCVYLVVCGLVMLCLFVFGILGCLIIVFYSCVEFGFWVGLWFVIVVFCGWWALRLW